MGGPWRFDSAKLMRLNDPERFETLPPAVLWQAMGVPDPRVIVEIGAGTGMFASAFSALAPGATVYAVDAEPAMVEWMQSNRPEVRDGRIVPALAQATGVPLENDLADIVFMINLHHELVDPTATYLEAKRVLRPGGRILVADWAPVETPKGPPLKVRVTAETLSAHLTAAGFGDVSIHKGLAWHSLVTATRPLVLA